MSPPGARRVVLGGIPTGTIRCPQCQVVDPGVTPTVTPHFGQRTSMSSTAHLKNGAGGYHHGSPPRQHLPRR